MNDALLLGFDAREMYRDPNETWGSNRRSSFLLKMDVLKPLSTDPQVWNSVFDNTRLLLPEWVGPVQNLWDNLESLRLTVANNIKALNKPFWIIAITRFVTSDVQGELGAEYQITPDSLKSEWKLLGYDISDSYLLSGLTNCDYEQEDNLIYLRNHWHERLNDFHLIKTFSDAEEFRQFTNERVPEHAPFFVHALHLIDECS